MNLYFYYKDIIIRCKTLNYLNSHFVNCKQIILVILNVLLFRNQFPLIKFSCICFLFFIRLSGAKILINKLPPPRSSMNTPVIPISEFYETLYILYNIETHDISDQFVSHVSSKIFLRSERRRKKNFQIGEKISFVHFIVCSTTNCFQAEFCTLFLWFAIFCTVCLHLQC